MELYFTATGENAMINNPGMEHGVLHV